MENIQNNGFYMGATAIKVNFILCCDWKALYLLLGTVRPSSQGEFCIWCHCPKSQIADFSIQSWSDKLRSSAEASACLNDNTNKNSRGYLEKSIIPIDFMNTVPDILHLRIRISLKLFNQLVSWAVDQNNKVALEREMQRIKVPFHFWEENGDNGKGSVSKWSQPDGNELWKIMRDLKLANVLYEQNDRRLKHLAALGMDQLKSEARKNDIPIVKGMKKAVLVAELEKKLGIGVKLPKQGRLRVSYQFDDNELEEEDRNKLDLDGLQKLWEDFYKMMEALKARPQEAGYMSASQFRAEARLWASRFADLTFPQDVIPYIHCELLFLNIYFSLAVKGLKRGTSAR
jgi:hypothetical protein